jgi:hypothetical protein
MRNIMTHCFLSIEHEVSAERGQFQLVGFDLMVDTELKVHLLEVNYNPSLSTHTTVLQAVVPPVLREVIGMVLEVHARQSEHEEKGGGTWCPLPLAAQVASETLLPLPHRPTAPASLAADEGAAVATDGDETTSESGSEASLSV